MSSTLDARVPDLRGGILYTCGAAFLLAAMDALSKILVADYPVATVLWVRMWFFLAIVLTVAVRKRGWRQCYASGVPKLQVVRAFVQVSNMFALVTGFSLMALADVHAVLALGPLIVTALSAPILGETVGIRRWMAVGVGFVGMLVILRPGIGVFEPTALIALLAAFLYGAYQIVTKLVSRHDESDTTLLYTGTIGLIMTSIVVPFVWVTPNFIDFCLMGFSGAMALAAHYCLVEGLSRAPAATVQPYNYSMLVWAVLIGYGVWGDLPDLPTLIGAAIIVASGVYVFRREAARAK